MKTRNYAALRRKMWMMTITTGVLCQLIPFSCGRGILNLVTPVFLDDTVNILDWVVKAVAPLVLP